MADHFEKAMQDILLRTEGNGGPSNKDVLIAMSALADDMDERHEENVGVISKLVENERNRETRIVSLETRVKKAEEDCPKVIEEAITKGVELAVTKADKIHGDKHAEYVATLTKPRRDSDPKGRSFRPAREQEKQVWLMWMVGSKLSYIIYGIVVGVSVWLFERLITGN